MTEPQQPFIYDTNITDTTDSSGEPVEPCAEPGAPCTCDPKPDGTFQKNVRMTAPAPGARRTHNF